MADFGLMAGLYAHLSRDPVPSALMKSRAPNRDIPWQQGPEMSASGDGAQVLSRQTLYGQSILKPVTNIFIGPIRFGLEIGGMVRG